MRSDDQAKERFRIEAGMAGMVMVTLVLLVVQLQLDTSALFLT
ncbi:MAG TPA: hypothetical protein VF603_04940 [Allosphingosinicella sp.]|jgi:hypothetical protein